MGCMSNDHSQSKELWLHISQNIVACMKWHLENFEPETFQLYEEETLHLLHFLNVSIKVDCEGSEDQFKQYDRKAFWRNCNLVKLLLPKKAQMAAKYAMQ